MLKRGKLAAAVFALLIVVVLAGCQTTPGTTAEGTPTVAPATGATGGTTPEATAAATTAATSMETGTASVATSAATSETGASAASTGTPAASGASDSSPTGAARASGTPERLPATGTDDVPEVTYVATEYQYEGPDTIAGGWTRLTLDNQGEQPHELWVASTPKDKTVEDLMAAFSGEIPDWVAFYGLVAAGPGESSSLIVDLKPGNYILFSMAGGGGPGGGEGQQPDAARGMVKPITVGEPPAGAAGVAMPETSATIQMADFAFVVDKETLPAGEHLFHLQNIGKEIHEVVFEKMKPGATMDQVKAALEKEMSGTPVPEEDLPVEMPEGAAGAFAILSPGLESYRTFNLEPGEYLLICHVPSAANDGKPHYDLGMMRTITVK